MHNVHVSYGLVEFVLIDRGETSYAAKKLERVEVRIGDMQIWMAIAWV